MKVVNPDADVNLIPHINRFVDMAAGELYLIESAEDYLSLPQSIITMLGDQWYTLQGLTPPNAL